MASVLDRPASVDRERPSFSIEKPFDVSLGLNFEGAQILVKALSRSLQLQQISQIKDPSTMVKECMELMSGLNAPSTLIHQMRERLKEVLREFQSEEEESFAFPPK